MQLLDKVTSLFAKKPQEQEYFFALLLKEKSIKAVVWEEKEGEVRVVDSATVDSEKHIEEVDDDKLLALADQAIGLAEKTLPSSIKTSKTIFGVHDWWVEKTTIKEPYFSKIKKITKELALSPLGFVVFPEAITHLLKRQEGTPPTVLLVFIGESNLGVTLVRSGRIEISKTAPKDGKSDSEVAAGLIKSFGDVEILPSRMVLFDGEIALEEIKQEFISYPWTKELAFLHFPKIDTLAEGLDVKAVVSGAAKEMGFSFEDVDQGPAENPDSEEEPVKENLAKKTGKEEEDEKKPEEAFGFVQEHDVLEEEALEDRLKDIEDIEEEEEEEEEPSIKFPHVSVGPLFASLGAMLPKLPTPSVGIRWWLVAAVLGGLLAIFIALFFFVPKATIILYAQTRTLENDVEITIDTNATVVDKEKKKIPAAAVELQQEGEKSQATTGKKTVGDRARGEVTIYNKTENRKTFPKGTVLAGPQSLTFILDEEATVASTAAFELTPSSVKTKVTAGQIGEESNIAAGTNLPFKEFPTSSYFAKNEAAFAGGTKREIVAVGVEDQDALLVALTTELKERAKEELMTKSAGSRLVDTAIKETIATKKFSKDAGEEATSLSLTLAVTFSALTYKDRDLLDVIGTQIEQDVPSGFLFKKDTFETKVVASGKEKAGLTNLTIHYKAALIPNLDIEQLKKDITGKNRKAVEAYLQSLPLDRFTIAQNIQFPGLNLLPQVGSNIVIRVETR